MKILTVYIILYVLITVLCMPPKLLRASLDANSNVGNEDKDDFTSTPNEDAGEESSQLHGSSRFLASTKYRTWPPHNYKMTCKRYPRICHVKGSPGPDCCRNKCVNVKTDNYNCGMCGLKCRHHEICCNGRCVNPFYDRRHCGGCHNKCKKGNFCDYGMCNYA